MRTLLRSLALVALTATPALAEPANTNLLDPNYGLMAWTLLVFVGLFLILKFFAFGPILKSVEAREQALGIVRVGDRAAPHPDDLVVRAQEHDIALARVIGQQAPVAREALRGDQNASYYSTKKRTAPMAVATPPRQQDSQAAA